MSAPSALSVLSNADIWHHVANWLELEHRVRCWLVCKGMRQAADTDGFDFGVSSLCVKLTQTEGPHTFLDAFHHVTFRDNFPNTEFLYDIEDWAISAEHWMYNALLQEKGCWMYAGAARTRPARHVSCGCKSVCWDAYNALRAALRDDRNALLFHIRNFNGPVSLIRDPNHMTLAHNAAWQGNIDCLSAVLDIDSSLALDTRPGLSVLHILALRGHHDGLGDLVATHKLDPNIACWDNRTPLHMAVEGEHVGCVDELVRVGADLNAAGTRDKNTPLLLACSIGSAKCIRTLLQRYRADLDVVNTHKRSALHLVCANGCLRSTKTLLRFWKNRPLNPIDHVGDTPLHVATENGFINSALLLVERVQTSRTSLRSLLDGTNMHGMTPMHIACKNGFSGITECFAKHGADVTMTDHRGYTPLHWAARNGWEACIRILLRHAQGVDVNAMAALDLRSTPLHCAVRYGGHSGAACSCIYTLITVPHIDVDACDANGLTPLHIATIQRSLPIVSALLSTGSGANVNARTRDNYGATALHLACQSNWLDGIDLLLRSGACVDAQDRNGCTPLMCCVCRSSAIVAAHQCAAKLFSWNCNPDIKDYERQWTALHWGAAEGTETYVHTLAENGADVNAGDMVGRTPLHIASTRGSITIVKQLVADGAHVLSVDYLQRTPRALAEKIDIQFFLELATD